MHAKSEPRAEHTDMGCGRCCKRRSFVDKLRVTKLIVRVTPRCSVVTKLIVRVTPRCSVVTKLIVRVTPRCSVAAL